MKFSRKLIFLATILIVVSIVSIYFGSVKSVEGATVSCPGGSTGTAATDASGNPVLNCPDVVTTTPATTTPAAASCTGIICAPKISDCKSKKLYSNQTCCASQATKKTACQP